MFRLACPKGVHDNRVISFLKNEREMIEAEDFKREPDEEGLVHYIFPDMVEDMFRYIVNQLQNQGVTMIGIDSQLTEKKIMKLASLIEMTPLDDQGEGQELKIVKQIKQVLSKDPDPTSKLWMKMADIIGDFEDKAQVDDIASTEYDREFYDDGDVNLHHDRSKASDSYKLSEEKVRKVIRKMIRQ